MAGKLLVVATPIGNLDDLSPRARAAFESADLVACEDTRHTGRLLAHLGIKKPLVSLHEHNERQRLPRLLADLQEGKTIAVASDAGTPLLSDPGFLLVREAAALGVRIEPIPGAAAPLAALVVSGLPPYPFTFAGFAAAEDRQAPRLLQALGRPRPHPGGLRVPPPPPRQPGGRPGRARGPPGGGRPRADQDARGGAARPALRAARGAEGRARRSRGSSCW